MASLRDLLKRLGGGLKPLPPPVQIQLTRQQLRSPRVQDAYRQSIPSQRQAASRTGFAQGFQESLATAPKRVPQKIDYPQPVKRAVANLPALARYPVQAAGFLGRELARAPFRVAAGALGTIAARSSQERLGSLGTLVEGGLDVATLGVGSQALKLPLKGAIKRGAVQGAKLGAGFGVSTGLQAEGSVGDKLKQAAKSAVVGGVSGLALGGAAAPAGALIGKTFKISKKAVQAINKDVKSSFMLVATKKSGTYKIARRVYETAKGKPGQFRNPKYNSQAGFIDFSAIAKSIKNLGKRSAKDVSESSIQGIPEEAGSKVSKQLLPPKNLAGTSSPLYKIGTSNQSFSNVSKEVSQLKVNTPSIPQKALGQMPPTTSNLRQVASQSQPNPIVNLAKGQGIDLNPAILRKRESLIKELQTEVFTPPTEIGVTQKVNIMDKLKSPSEVYEKIGQGKAAEALRLSDIKTKREIPAHITQIQDWVQRVGKRQEQVFDALDGKNVSLTSDEKIVVKEIQDYLATWAERLELPKDRQITNYITHIFEPDLIKKEFDPELAKLITGKVPGSVYDPFLEQRLGKLGYKKDIGLALQAYAKRGVRKANFDPVLSVIKERSKTMELSQMNYVRKNLERINLRPTEIDNAVDNFIKSTPVGYKFGQRPTMRLSQLLRRMGYRGALGGNIGSALKNLTQGVNTYSKLGERYTLSGYLQALKPGARKELEQAGVLASSFIDDANVSVYKTLLKKVDNVLFYAFEKAEQINRGAAYFGAKQKAIHAGMSADDAVIEGLKVARQTQFTFGAVDTPEILSSDIMKTFGQFQSFNLKQAEFIKNMVKNKEWAGMLRFVAANALVVGTVGKLIGFETKDVIPFSGIATGQTKFGQTPAIGAIATTAGALLGVEGKYGQPLGLKDVGSSLVPIIPGGVQAKKTIQGLGASSQGASTSATGRVRYPVQDEAITKFRNIIFGQYSNKIGRFYFDNALTPLGDKDSAIFQQRIKNGEDPVQVWKMMYIKKVQGSVKDKVSEIQKDKTITPEQKQQAIQVARSQAAKLIQELQRL